MNNDYYGSEFFLFQKLFGEVLSTPDSSLSIGTLIILLVN